MNESPKETLEVRILDFPASTFGGLRDHAKMYGVDSKSNIAIVRWSLTEFLRMVRLCKQRKLDPATLAPIGDNGT